MPLSASGPFPLQDTLADMRKLLRRLRRVADRSEPFLFSSSRNRAIRWVRSDPLFRNVESSTTSLTLRAPSKPSHRFRCAIPLVSVPAAIEHSNTQDRSQTNSSRLNGRRRRNSVGDSQVHLLHPARPGPQGMSLDIPAVPARRKHRPAGLQEYLDSFPGDRAAQGAADALENRLLNSYGVVHSTDWNWFENGLAYSNARLPQALIRAGLRSGSDEMVSTGLEALGWLSTIQRCEIKGHFVPIGSHGFYSKKTEKARFDQQPVEAGAVVSACLQAYLATGKGRWRKEAWNAFQ